MMTFVRFLVICAHLTWTSIAYAVARVGQIAMSVVRSPEERREQRERLRAVSLVRFLRRLGGAFVKIGQVLSARPDVLPSTMIDELSTLQDHVPPFAFARVRRVIEDDLGRPVDELFADIEPTPVAAASIAQVHEAHLRDGTRVAVKVQRPEVTRNMRRDLRILRNAARLAGSLPALRSLSLPQIAGELSRAIESQLDFPREVDNNRRFAKAFADISWVRLPEVHDALSGDRVITMEFVEGAKLTDVVSDPPLPRAEMAERIFKLYLAMVFEHRFLHADLHPGNILVEEDGTYVLLDTGLVHAVPDYYVRKFLRVALAFTTLDGALIGDAYLEGHELGDEARGRILADMDALGARFREAAGGSGDAANGNAFVETNLATALSEVFDLMRRHRLHVDPEWTGLLLSDITFEGIAKMLDDEIDFTGLIARELPRYLMTSGLTLDDPVVVAVLSRAGAPTPPAPRSEAARTTFRHSVGSTIVLTPLSTSA